MPLRMIHIIVLKKYSEELIKELEKFDLIESWKVSELEQEKIMFAVLLTVENSQKLLDTLNNKLDKKRLIRVVILGVEATLPPQENNQPKKTSIFKLANESQRTLREELYSQIVTGSTLDINYILLIFFSTIVAALGLLYNQVAIIIAAMVIAPMLGPNLGMALAAVLGDTKLLWQAVKTNIVGISVCLLLSILLGIFWPSGIDTTELMQRTEVNYSSIVLALASGAAAALCITSNLSTALVGVMVSVALLPVLVVMGVTLGAGLYWEAIGATILFAVNIVCVNLSANLIFLFKQIHPQRWYEKQKAKKAIFWYLSFWLVSLSILMLAIYFHHFHLISKLLHRN